MSATLLERVARCEPSAFDECIDCYGGLVWSLARRYCAADTDVEDAVQEAFISLWKTAHRFDPSVASEKTFVAMVARRRMIDAYRQHRSRRDDPGHGDPGSAHDEHIAHHAHGADPLHHAPPEVGAEISSVARLMESLSHSQRSVIELSVYHGLSHAEIAARLEMPLGTVKSHARRGLLLLRERIGGAS